MECGCRCAKAKKLPGVKIEDDDMDLSMSAEMFAQASTIALYSKYVDQAISLLMEPKALSLNKRKCKIDLFCWRYTLHS